MVNFYKVKKWGAGFLNGFVPVIVFLIMILLGDLMLAIIGVVIIIPLVVWISKRLIAHPMLQCIEGDGLLVLTPDSTGLIDSFIVKVSNPWLIGKYAGKKVETIFNREIVNYLGPPKKTTATVEEEGENEIMRMVLPKREKNNAIFTFGQMPCLLYNKNLGEFITKDAFANLERDTFVKHMVLYLNRKVEDLTSQLRDFARYIVEQTRPQKQSFLGSKIFMIIIIMIILGVLALLVLPLLSEAGGPVSGAFQQAGSIFAPVVRP